MPKTGSLGSGFDHLRGARSGIRTTGSAAPPASAPANTAAPTISGIKTNGQTLTAATGSWSNSPTSYAYQWKRAGTNISGATASTYLLVTGDVGSAITVAVTATNSFGISSAATSTATSAIAAVLSIGGTPVTAAAQNVAYTGFSIAGAGGHTPYVYSVQTGTLPAGLALNSSTGAVAGTPTVVQTQTGIVLRVTDADGLTADLASFQIAVSALAAVAVLIVLGDSQSDGSKNSIADLPTTPINYTTTDASVVTWDITTQSLITRPASGSEPAAMDNIPFPTPVGWVREYTRRWRIANPSSTLYVFQYSRSGTGFDSSGPAGDDWSVGRSSGLYSTTTTNWTAFVGALAAIGKTPGTVTFATSLGWNSALNGTLSAAYAAKLSAFMSAIRTDMLGATGLALIMRMQLDKIGTYTQAATIRANQATYVAGDAHARLVNCDGLVNVNPTGGGDQHYTAAGHIALGRYCYWSAAGQWFPQSDFTNLVTWEALPYDLQNTLVSSTYSVMYDQSGNGHALSQSTPGQRPGQTTINGAICASFDGSNDHLASNSPWLYAQGTCGMFMAIKSPGGSVSGAVYNEAHATNFQPFYVPVTGNTATDTTMRALIRDDALNIKVNGTIGPTLFNNVMNAAAITDSGSSIVGYANGTAGTAVSYTRGTTTLNVNNLGAQTSSGSTAGFLSMALGTIWTTAAVPDATYRANAQAYLQREFGTP